MTTLQQILTLFVNNLKVTFRSFARYRLYSVLNIGSLAVAFSAIILIGVYVHYETHFESFHSKADRVFRPTYHRIDQQGFDVHWARIPVTYINELPNAVPEIEHLIRFQNQEQQYVRIGREKFKPKHAYVTDAAVFEVFDFDLIEGDPMTALQAPFAVVLTESLAKKYFGTGNALGQQISVVGDWTPEETTYHVTGVMRDLPAHTHIPVELLLSFESDEARSGWAYVYTLLKEGTHIEQVEAKMDAFVESYETDPYPEGTEFVFQPLTDIHLHSNLAREIVVNGNFKYVRIFLFIGLFVLIIALINFANLSSALAMTRSKEVGVRRILGAGSKQLMAAAWTDSIISNLIALVIGGVIAAAVFMPFSQITGITFLVPKLWMMGSMLALALISGLLAGLYPSWIRLVSSSLQQVRDQHQFTWSSNRGFSFKRAMVTLQFAISILLLASAGVAFQQFRYLEQKDLGMVKDQIIAISNVPNRITADYMVFKELLSNLPGITGVAACMQVPSSEIRDVGAVQVQGRGDDESQAPMIDIQVVDPAYPALMGMQVLAGDLEALDRATVGTPNITDDYTYQDYLLDQTRHYVINETAMRQLGWTTPTEAINQQINWSNSGFDLAYGAVVAVVKDFHQESLKNTIDPVVMMYEPIWLRTFLIKVRTDEIQQTIAGIENNWSELFPNYALEYHFLDELYENLYKNDRVQLHLFYALSALAIFIAFAGLFSLVAFALRTRAKEMAIRKVVGADMRALVQLIGRDYFWVLILGAAMAVPLSYYWVSLWLDGFAYRVDITPMVYICAVLAIGILLAMTIFWQTLRSAESNPMEVLRE